MKLILRTGPFNIYDFKIAKANIKNFIKIEAERVEIDMYDTYDPQIINVYNTLLWIKMKCELVMQIKNNWNILERKEYKLFENL